MSNAISQHYTDQSFTWPLRSGDKVALFSDMVRGWQLDVAERLLSDQHAGFAVLSIVVSYFEMIATYQRGESVIGRSKTYSLEGLHLVLDPHRTTSPSTMPDDVFKKVREVIYEDLRCGLYHAGMTGPRILIRIADDMPIVGVSDGLVLIDPKKLLEAVQSHFTWYIAALMNPDPKYDRLRVHFERRFDQPRPAKPARKKAEKRK